MAGRLGQKARWLRHPKRTIRLGEPADTQLCLSSASGPAESRLSTLDAPTGAALGQVQRFATSRTSCCLSNLGYSEHLKRLFRHLSSQFDVCQAGKHAICCKLLDSTEPAGPSAMFALACPMANLLPRVAVGSPIPRGPDLRQSTHPSSLASPGHITCTTCLEIGGGT